ncbi:host cell division inhibitor Icd-like protein [Salmonella enterica]|nr:host cell division inhibitor Icd-like protein [Salmonella enterica]
MVSHALKEKGNAANVAFGNQTDHWSGLSFVFLRCRASSSACAISTIARMSVPALSPISSILASVSSALFSSSCKLSGPVAVACRRATSPRIAVTINPALLSPACLTSSIDSITSCGTRTVVSCDLAFLFGVAIAETPEHECVSVYRKKEIQKGLTCVSWGNIVKHTKQVIGNTMFNASDCWSSAEASNHNVTEAYIMACSHDTQIRPEFTYLFLGTPSDKPNTMPVVLRVEANTEQQACSHFLNWNLVFAAQIRTKAPYRLQLMDGADRFSWIFEQLPDVCTSGVQEVAYV